MSQHIYKFDKPVEARFTGGRWDGLIAHIFEAPEIMVVVPRGENNADLLDMGSNYDAFPAGAVPYQRLAQVTTIHGHGVGVIDYQQTGS